MRKKLRDTISELAAILEAEDIDEIELRRWWTTVRVTRRRRTSATEASASGDAVVEGTGAEVRSPAERTASEAGEAATPTEAADTIVSPMVGTFYRASDPDSEPFVSVGDRVEVGEVLCIIEAMKLMNEIEADRSGIIKEVLVRDNQPVEFGQPLFLVESA
jgi:acetyl-CoA carboxylase biotin carboxyl carrier protein